jgi:hypothetical protein
MQKQTKAARAARMAQVEADALAVAQAALVAAQGEPQGEPQGKPQGKPQGDEGEPQGRPRFAHMSPEAAAAGGYKAHPLTRRPKREGEFGDVVVPGVAAASRRTLARIDGVNRKYRVCAGAHDKYGKVRVSTYRKYILGIMLDNDNKHSAIGQYNASPWPDLRPMCDRHTFDWAAREGYIAWLD